MTKIEFLKRTIEKHERNLKALHDRQFDVIANYATEIRRINSIVGTLVYAVDREEKNIDGIISLCRTGK